MNIDPRENNKDNYKNGSRVKVTMLNETRNGSITRQLGNRHFLVRLDFPFRLTNPGKIWLEVCRDYAHQSIEIR